MEAIYARQSIDKKDSISIENQIELCRKEIRDAEPLIYTDKGYSGSNIRRPGFERLLSDVKLGRVNRVVVYRLDRMSRSIVDFSNLMQLFGEKSCSFVSATEKFDTAAPIGRAMLNITMVFAQLERETIQERIKDNYYSRAKKGMYLGGRPPFGYKKSPYVHNGINTSVYVPDENMEIVLSVFREYSARSVSLADIREQLNALGIKSSCQKNWETGKLMRILRNPAYVKADADVYVYYKNKSVNITNDVCDFTGQNGCYLYGKRSSDTGKYSPPSECFLSVAPHIGVIPSDIFLKCQYKLDENKKIKNSGKGKYTWLSGIVKCRKCGYAATVSRYKDEKYFTCRGKNVYNACEGFAHTVYIADVEAAVEKCLLERLKNLKAVKIYGNKSSTAENDGIKIQIVKIQQQIEKLINQLPELSGSAVSYINDKINELDNIKASLCEKIKETSKPPESKVSKILSSIDNWKKFSLEAKKETVAAVIKRVSISEDEIKIEWKF